MMRAKIIYEKVAVYKDTLEAVIFHEKIGQLDTFIRLCCLNLKLNDASAQEGKLKQSLGEKVSKAHADTMQDKIENI